MSSEEVLTDPPGFYLLGHARVLVVSSPRDGWLRILGLLHALEQPQIVEEADELIGLVMAEAVAAPVAACRVWVRQRRVRARARARALFDESALSPLRATPDRPIFTPTPESSPRFR